MKKISALICLLIVLISCGKKRDKVRLELQKQANDVSASFTKEKADKLVVDYNQYIKDFPDDTINRSFMMNGVEVCILNNDAVGALKFTETFIQKYPDDPRAAIMQFKRGIIFDLLVHDPLRSVAEYEIFIKNYPTHPWKESAENAILLSRDPQGYIETVIKGGQSDTLETSK